MNSYNPPNPKTYRMLIALAQAEDLGCGDITSDVTIAEDRQGAGRLVFREEGVLCGMPIVEQVLMAYDPALELSDVACDGDTIANGAAVARVEGPLLALLAAERVVLNFLQRLSGIATQTARYVQAAQGTAARICDTRKTTPGWRALEKYAVRCGGGVNHRQGLYDAVLIKDNHLAALGAANLKDGLIAAVQRVRAVGRPVDFIQVEVDTLEQLTTVLTVDGIDMILLDNMTPEQMTRAVALRNDAGKEGAVLLEASGGVRLEAVAAIARSGVDRISIGALTHSVTNLDIGLDFDSA